MINALSRNPCDLKYRHCTVRMTDLKEYLGIFISSEESNKTREIDLNEVPAWLKGQT